MLSPEPVAPITVQLANRAVTVAPATLGQLLRVLRAIDGSQMVEEIAALFISADSEHGLPVAKLVQTLARHGDRALAVLAELLLVPAKELEGLPPDEAIALFAAAIRVNADFFSRRLMPAIAAMLTTASTTPSAVPGDQAEEAQPEMQPAES